MTARIKTYSEHFPWFISDGNSSFRDMIVTSTRTDTDKEKSTTPKEHLQEIPTDHNNSSGNWEDSKVVVVARVGDYDNDTGGEWAIITEPKEINYTDKGHEDFLSKNSTESSDYFLGNDDVQKYLNDYQDLLYTFKDFVKIGASPSVRKNISQHNVRNRNNEKMFNVTYVMPIPKTKKYFEIKLTNLTKTQYNEINILLQQHIIRRTNSTEITKSKEQDIVYVDENVMGNSLVSHALSVPLSSHDKTSKPLLHTVKLNEDSKNEPIPDLFGPLLTPEGFNYFLKNFDAIHFNLNNTSVNQTSSLPPTLIQNNGFHAEIATDYIKNYDANGEGNAQEDSYYSQTSGNSKDLSVSNFERIGSDRPTLSPHLRRNRTQLFLKTRSKRPIMNAPDNVLNTRKRKVSHTTDIVSELPITTDSSALLLNPSNNNINSNFNHINNASNPTIDQITRMNRFQNITTKQDSGIPNNNNSRISAQDWLDLYKLYNSSLTKPIGPSTSSDPEPSLTNALLNKAEVPKPLNVMEAAEWLIDMKRKMDEDDRKKEERYKNYIKQFLGGDEGFTPLGRENNGNIMKINKQENILEELKFLMLDYFASLNFKTEESTSNNTSSAVQSILNATNIFELMEQSSQLVKLNLNIKLESDTKEPTKFVKQIVEKQVEKCKKIFDNGLTLRATQKSSSLTKKNGHRRFMVFTKCMNFKLKQCIKNFSLWLEKGKFFLRPHFKLDRAYENYEIERNLYCLRNYNPSSLGSNPHGVRVKPGLKLNRKSLPWKIGARRNKQRYNMRANKDKKLKTRQHNQNSDGSNILGSRRYKQQHIFKQRPKGPKVQKHPHQQETDAIM